MLRRIKTIVLTIALNLGLVLTAGTTLAYAQTTGPISCGSTGNITKTDGCADTNADAKINNTIARAIQIFQIIVGLISVFMLIFGGLKYITSGGESGGVQSGKNTILYAVIGLVVVGLAQIIVQFTLNRVNNAGTAGGI